MGLKKIEPSFSYSKKGKAITFKWDGAGLDNKQRIVVLEAELCDSYNSFHIEAHLARVSIMVSEGIIIDKLIFIIRPSGYKELKKLIDNWLPLFKNAIKVSFPTIQYFDEKGRKI